MISLIITVIQIILQEAFSMDVIHCPLCHQINTGKIGNRQYYCWNCLIEFEIQGRNRDRIKMFVVEEDGSLIELKNKPT